MHLSLGYKVFGPNARKIQETRRRGGASTDPLKVVGRCLGGAKSGGVTTRSRKSPMKTLERFKKCSGGGYRNRRSRQPAGGESGEEFLIGANHWSSRWFPCKKINLCGRRKSHGVEVVGTGETSKARMDSEGRSGGESCDDRKGSSELPEGGGVGLLGKKGIIR